MSICREWRMARVSATRVWLCVVALCVTAMALFAVSPVLAIPSKNSFKVEHFKVISSSTQAGAHENLTTEFDIAHNTGGETFNDLRTPVVELPPGWLGSNTAVPVCTETQLVDNGPLGPKQSACPVASQVGTISFETVTASGPVKFLTPLYNMQVSSPGFAAAFGLKSLVLTQLLYVTVRPGDSGLTITTPNVEGFVQPHKIAVTVWGVPAAREHDAERDRNCEGEECEGGDESAGILQRPYLTTPTNCDGPSTARLTATAWEGQESEATTATPAMTGCERVPFNPSLVVAPTTSSAESSSGLNVSLVVPQEWSSPNTLSTANLKDTAIALPVGYTANPSLAAGLGACAPAQFEAETYSSPPGEGCPQEAKIGTVEVETPVLVGGEKLSGAVYIATPYDNPFDSLLALYIVVKDPQLGVIVKLAGKIDANPVTGQLVTTFDNNPQVPFSKFTLRLRQGATSPLVSPPACGTYTAAGTFTPWSAPLTPFPVNSSFQIEHGIGGGACPPGGVPPFHPLVVSGAENNAAGSYSPFYLRIERQDGEQEITRFSTVLPPGLSGNLTGIPFCADSAIEAAKSVTGAEEQERPSCPAASEIGHTIVEAGVGAVLAQTPGRIYLAGPYHGAPLSIVSITSAKVGPFDLGTVVVRFALDINPITAQVEVSGAQSDAIPHIIAGIVVHVRDIRVYMNRPSFTLNPTSCERMGISETIGGAGADSSNPAGQQFVGVSAPFQAADCSSLAFEPTFKVSTSAKTSRADGASLTVHLTMPGRLGAQANIRQVKVELPKALPSRLPTLQKACTKAQFEANPAGCPAASIVGHAKAITPILPVPLEGPAYFVSNGGAAWPNLIIVLQGYGFTIDLVGDTFISKQGVTSSTFEAVPDQPVTSFELTLPKGPYSALAALGNLCAPTKTVTVKKKVTVKVRGRRRTLTRKVKQAERAGLTMPTEFIAQNGVAIHQETPVSVTECPAAKVAKKKIESGSGKGGRAKRG